jgi:dicarboxylate transporter 10
MADSGKMLDTTQQVAPAQTPAQSKPKQVHYPFWFGGSASCFAAGVTHPLDLGMFGVMIWILLYRLLTLHS